MLYDLLGGLYNSSFVIEEMHEPWSSWKMLALRSCIQRILCLMSVVNRIPSYRFSVAPMLDWTDRHFRYFMRGITQHALFYTEMVTTPALLHGQAERYLQYDQQEHPLAIQLGGSHPHELATCAKMAQTWGYQEVNLNVGCPSDRVQNNRMGACLMAHPEIVADCFKAMQDAVSIPVSLKHRIGIDGRESYQELVDFVGQSVKAGCKEFIVHARIAILKGLSPKQNREIPPLRYDMAARLKADFPEVAFILNGGITTIDEAKEHLKTFDGVMVGRAAYQNCYEWARVDQQIFNDDSPVVTRYQALDRMRPYIEQHLASGGTLQNIAHHLLGLAHGISGAKRFRQLLSAEIYKREQPPMSLFDQALDILLQSEE